MTFLNIRPLTFAILTALVVTGCSVYENQGRKSFEADSSGRTLSLASLDMHEPETCWTQNANEALWQINDNNSLSVKKISHDKIQVCMEPQHQNEE